MVAVVLGPSLVGAVALALFAAVSAVLIVLLCAKRQEDESDGVVTDGNQGMFERRGGSHLEEVGNGKEVKPLESQTAVGLSHSPPSAVIEMSRRNSSEVSHHSKRNPSDSLPPVKAEQIQQRELVDIRPQDGVVKEIDRKKNRSKTMPIQEQRAPYDTSDGSDETYARVQDVAKPAENAYLVVDLKGKEEQYEIVNSEVKRKRRAASSPEGEIASVVSQMSTTSNAVDPSIFNVGLQKQEVAQENSAGSGVYAIVMEDNKKEERPRTSSRLSIFKKSKKKTRSLDDRAEKGNNYVLQETRNCTSLDATAVAAGAHSPPPVPPLENLKHIAEEQRKSVHLHSMSDDENRSMKSFGSNPGTPLGSPGRRMTRPSIDSGSYRSHTPIDICPPRSSPDECDDINNPYMVVSEELKNKSLEKIDKAGLGSPPGVIRRRTKERILAEFELRGQRLMKRHSVPLLLDALAKEQGTCFYGNAEDLYAKVDLKQKEEDRQRSDLYARVDKFQTGFKTFYPSMMEKKIEQHYEGGYSVVREVSKSLPSPRTGYDPSRMKREVINKGTEGRLVRLKSWSPYCSLETKQDGVEIQPDCFYETIENGPMSN